jgi:D-ribulokinase
MQQRPAFLGIDLGTSGVRAVAIDGTPDELASAACPLPPVERPAAGYSQQDPRLWWTATVQVLRALVRSLPNHRPRCLAVDGTSATVLLCGADGQPRTPALMYDDTRSGSVLPILRAAAPPASPVHSASSSLAKCLYLVQERAAARELRALHQADWILGMLCGRFGISDENNCLKLGYDAVERRWPEWINAIRLSGVSLPEVHPAGVVIGTIDPEAARLTGLPGSCLIATGTTDSTAAAIASGICRTGDAVSSLGSTLVLKVLAATPVFEPDFGVYSHRLRDAWLVGGASNSGGAVLAHYFSARRIAELSEAIDPERPSGLEYYPLLRPGERFPLNDAAFPPVLTPRPADEANFLQGLLEGVANIEQRGYRLLADLGAPYPERVISIGGGAVNEVWRRLRERRLGVPVESAAERQAAFGSAMLALQGFRERDR